MSDKTRGAQAAGVQLAERWGFRIIEHGHYMVVVEATAVDEHLNAGGIVHGGYLAALADWATGAVVHSALGPDRFAPHSNLNIQFVHGAGRGHALRCVARCVHLGAQAASAEARIESDGRHVASALSSHTVITRRA